MAYNGDYQGQQQRPYAGPAGGRPGPGPGPGPRPYGAAYRPPQQQQPQQQYDRYNEGYGYNESYEQYDDGYGNNYGPPPQQNMNYGRGAPPPQNAGYQDYNSGGPGPAGPGRGGYPPVRGRGGPMMRGRGGGPAMGGGRGFPPQGRGGFRPQPLERSATADPYARRGPPPQGGFDQDLSGRMAGMDIGGRRPTLTGQGPNGGRGPMPPQEDFGRPSLDSQYSRGGPPGRGYDQHPPRGQPQDQGYGGYQDRGYQGPTSPMSEGFGPPGRSMTMPANHEPGDMGRQGLPPRMDSAPAVAQGVGMTPNQQLQGGHMQRAPPQRTYPQDPMSPTAFGQPQSAQLLDPGHGGEPARESIGDFYDEYYNDERDSYQSAAPSHHSGADYDQRGALGDPVELEQHMRAGPGRGTPQPGPARMPELSRTKSQPSLREPQAAVFEMAADLPPMPPTGNFQAYNPAMGDNGGPQGLPSNPSPARQAPPGGSMGGPGSGHPAPVRPGLMANSMVNINDKPVPVRNYQNMGQPSQAPMNAPPPQQYQQQYPPQQYQQQYNPQQPPPPNRPLSGVSEKIPVTTDELDRLREIIKHDPNDQQSALALAKKLVEAADTLVPKLPNPKDRVRARERYVMDSHKILKKLVSQQNPDAMFFLADCMGRGALGHEPDNKEAFTLYQSAAKLGHAAAAYRTAVCCEIGNDDGGGTRKDPLKAVQWYKRAATLGDTPAMYKVGMILLKGLLGQQRNPRESIGWLKRAAEGADAENPHALHELGMLYESAQPNDFIVRDEGYALQLFEQAANLGYKFSQYRLGCAFEYGLLGCPIDPRASISWYSQAAQQGEHQAELALSGWYLTGSDGILKQSDTEAYLWARKAAQAGLAKAEYAMGYFTEVGIGVPANLEDAKRWYWRAAAQNFPKARERLEDLKKTGRNAPRQRERISRSNMNKQQTDGECSVM